MKPESDGGIAHATARAPWGLLSCIAVEPPRPTRAHRLFARYVWWRIGATHWTSGPGNYSFDPACPLCRLKRVFAAMTNRQEKLFEKGFAAYADGLPRDAVPGYPDLDDRRWWLKGWYASRDDNDLFGKLR